MHNEKINILLIEDEEFDVRRVRNTLNFFEEKIFLQDIVSNGSDAINLILENEGNYDIVIMDYQIAGALRGQELIKKIKGIDSTIQIIVITKLTINLTDFNFAKGLMEAGAFWYCTKYPGDIEEFIYQPTDFVMSIFNAFEKRSLEKLSRLSSQKLETGVDNMLNRKQILSVSDYMENVKNKIDKVAGSDINILITGESGTGKELVAYNIHYKSKRKLENIVTINCGSIPNDLIESELFGYEKGAFTGANNNKQGLFELADKGTIFLDEVAELPLNAQVKLLRVIQDGTIEKIGRTKSKEVDVRIISATNKKLEEEVKKGNFREDLYYRINVVPLNIPPLRDRGDDKELLFKHFIEKYSYDMGRTPPVIEDEVIIRLNEYDWPGNIRQLKNVAQRLIFDTEERVTVEDLEGAVTNKFNEKASSNKVFNFASLRTVEPLKDIERSFRTEYFNFVRDKSISDADASQKLGIAPPNYHRMCKELGLK